MHDMCAQVYIPWLQGGSQRKILQGQLLLLLLVGHQTYTSRIRQVPLTAELCLWPFFNPNVLSS